MATTAPQLGKTLTIRIGTPTGVTITNLRSNSLSSVTDMIEVTTKSSGTHKEYLPSFQDLTIDFEGVFTQTASSYGPEDVLATKIAGTSFTWEYGSGVATTLKITGTGYFTAFDLDDPHDDVTTFSGAIQNTGDPTIGAYSA
jgi:predicted secreted protein